MIQFAWESKCRRSKTNDENTTATTTPDLTLMAEDVQPRKRSSATLDCSAKHSGRMAILPSETDECSEDATSILDGMLACR
jgi:hypothetical protein